MEEHRSKMETFEEVLLPRIDALTQENEQLRKQLGEKCKTRRNLTLQRPSYPVSGFPLNASMKTP